MAECEDVGFHTVSVMNPPFARSPVLLVSVAPPLLKYNERRKAREISGV